MPRIEGTMKVLPVFRALWLAAASLLAASAAPAPDPGAPTHLSHGRFKDLQIYKPAGTPASFVLFLSGDEGWNATADRAARQLAQQGAMVAGIDWTEFRATLEAGRDQCEFPDGDLENLSHFV